MIVVRRTTEILAWRGAWPAFFALLAISLMFRMPPGGPVAPASGDGPGYLSGAYHLYGEHLYSMSPHDKPVAPALGREPGYPLFLAAIMAIDPSFRAYSPDCLHANDACPPSMFRVPRLANLLLILATGAILFSLGRTICGNPAGGLIAAAYLLLNTHMNKFWGDLMSDRLAVFLVAASMLALAEAWRRQTLWQYAVAGGVFALLTLTKAIFLPFCILSWCGGCAVILWTKSGVSTVRRMAALAAPACVFVLLVGGWIVRNHAVSGMARLTDARSGIALSTRAVFDDMPARDYAASLVFWTGSNGPKLAARWFGHGVADPFDLRTPGGYYDVGQNGYGRRVVAIMQADHLTYWQATREIDHQIIAGILHHLPGYLAAMLPLTYRGLWVDEFLWLGIPCLIAGTWRAARRRDGLLLVLFGIGIFNILAYAAVSLNIERYQLTSMPAVALAVAVMLCGRRVTQAEACVPSAT